MKLRILLIALSFSMALNLHLLLKEDASEIAVTQKDKVQVKQAAVQKISTSTTENKRKNLHQIKTDILELNDNKKDQLHKTQINTNQNFNEDDIEEAKEAWKRSATDFLAASVGLNQEQIDAFFALDGQRNLELDKYLQDRINNNGGDQFFYTLEDIVEENNINIKYLSRLKSLLGQQGYEDYKQFRNQYNQKIIESGEGFFLIEL